MVPEWIDKWFPDGSKEEDTEYGGVLSYTGEWHALTVGIATGILSAAFWLTGSPVTAALTIAMLATVSFGYESKARRIGIKIPEMKSNKARRSVRREPWYALGGGVASLGTLTALVPLVL
jgi:hypothetical protein